MSAINLPSFTPVEAKSIYDNKEKKCLSSAEKVKIAAATVFAFMFVGPFAIVVFFVMYDHYKNMDQAGDKQNNLEMNKINTLVAKCKKPTNKQPPIPEADRIQITGIKREIPVKGESKVEYCFIPKGSEKHLTSFQESQKMTFAVTWEVDVKLGKKGLKIIFKDANDKVYSLSQSSMNEPMGEVMKEMADQGYRLVHL